MTEGFLILLLSVFIVNWQTRVLGPLGMLLFMASILGIGVGIYLVGRESLTLAGIVLGVLFIAYFGIRRGSQIRTVQAIRAAFFSLKLKNPGVSNKELALVLIGNRYPRLMTRLFTVQELFETLEGIQFDWKIDRQVTFVLGSVIWAFENKQYTEEFKKQLEIKCVLDSRGMSRELATF